MGYVGNMVEKPVSIYDLQQALGTSETDLGSLCTHANINKWAKYKPFRLNKISLVTLQERKNATFGLQKVANTAAKTAWSNPTEANFNAAVTAAAAAWSYLKPRGAAVTGVHVDEPYRLADFVNDAETHMGYKHTTEPPLDIMGGWTIKRSNLQLVANTYKETTRGGTYDWVLSVNNGSGTTLPAGFLYESFKLRWSEATYDNINGADTMAIPITWLLDVANEYWRIGFLVFVPQFTLNGTSFGPYVGVITSAGLLRNSSSSSDTMKQISPEMCSNGLLAEYMNGYMTANSKTDYSFRALPIIIQNAQVSLSNNRATITGQTNSSCIIYTTPSGLGETKITVSGSTPDPSDEGDTQHIIDSITWTLSIKASNMVNTGSGESYNNHWVKMLCVTANLSQSRAYKATINCIVVDMYGNRTTINGTYPIAQNNKIVVNGTEYYGISVYGALELSFVSITSFSVARQ